MVCDISARKFRGSHPRRFTRNCFSEFSMDKAAPLLVSEIRARVTEQASIVLPAALPLIVTCADRRIWFSIRASLPRLKSPKHKLWWRDCPGHLAQTTPARTVARKFGADLIGNGNPPTPIKDFRLSLANRSAVSPFRGRRRSAGADAIAGRDFERLGRLFASPVGIQTALGGGTSWRICEWKLCHV